MKSQRLNDVNSLPEIQQIEKRVESLGNLVRAEVLAISEQGSLQMPIYKVTFGSQDPTAPVLGFVGGVHGLERIGSQVCISLLNSLSELIQWDSTIQRTLQNIRVFFIPTVNPIGILRKTRSNPRGVDLMRNAPIEARALISAVQSEIRESRASLTVDIHSGFGFQDRLWFPYAKTVKPFPDLHFAYSLKELLDRTYPHHIYRFEPQSKSYTTHGDLWDYIYDTHRAQEASGKYLPLCLEMGSWMWVKKNPWQIFSAEGPFNPLIGHRHKRTLRRHNTLMEFLIRAISSPDVWMNVSEEQQREFLQKARELWYE